MAEYVMKDLTSKAGLSEQFEIASAATSAWEDVYKRQGLLRHDVQDADVHVAWVPGAFEIPLVASKMAKSGKYWLLYTSRP